LSDKPVKVIVGWTLNIEGSAAYVVKSLVIKVEGKVRVFKEGVCRKYSIVRFNYSGRNLRRRCDGKAHLGLSAEVNSKAFKKE